MGNANELTDQPDWYKDAVIYEVHVRAFADSNGDGIGDFRGLTGKLDYLAQLGITALWLLPFYPSPLRDDGYDIADYTTVNPIYGVLRDVQRLIDAAHDRGLRVINELVLNHTSDQHPWFQRARNAPHGSRYRDWYVWTDDPSRYEEARVIFEDAETSNWTWDPVAGQYYWHRFFHHQPDLNYDNAEVRSTMLGMVDQWLAMGIDGVRLDAVPYLFERDDTNCENLPETHAYLKELRAHVDTHFPGRMLLGEANQWPEDSVAYFGDLAVGGDECHMNFHFPLMPRIYMSVRMEDRTPLIDILEDTPPIPQNCQWALFLRNHDELTLEMVTDEERDYMYRAYAADPQARINVGIRRRLAPLLGNDRRTIELLNGLLFSLPGTPVVYYGDEIGMGDNFYLGDRDAVRTPMQWGPDRNAGFSDANPQSLYLPCITDPEYHYETVNVEAQERNPNSLLWWMRRVIALRQRHPVFGRGDIEFLYPENAKVLSFLRRTPHEQILVVANLSRFAQRVSLDLPDHRGAVLWELFGNQEFGHVTDGRVDLALGPYGFYWFALVAQSADSPGIAVSGDDLPVLRVRDGWHALLTGSGRHRLEPALLPYLAHQRWYAGKSRRARGAVVMDAIPVSAGRGKAQAYVVLVQVEYTDGEPETYVVPVLVAGAGARAEEVLGEHPQAAIAWIDVQNTGERLLLFDATTSTGFLDASLAALRGRRRYASPSTKATLSWSAEPALRKALEGATTDDLRAIPVGADQSNSSTVFGNRMVVKLFRRAQDGVNPERELGQFLSDRYAQFPHVAPLLGSLEYQVPGAREPRTLAVANGYAANEGDVWRSTLDALSLFYEHALAAIPATQATEPPWASIVGLRHQQPPDHVAEAIGPYLDSAELLGTRTAGLHLTLASSADLAFVPEPFTSLYQRSVEQAMRSAVRPTLAQVRGALPRLRAIDSRLAASAEVLVDALPQVLAVSGELRRGRLDAMRTRIHGDLHLGQVLRSGRDFVFIDFEGEPSRPPSQRRIKRSPLVDVAGMVRSFQYASHAGLVAMEERGLVTKRSYPALAARGRVWDTWVTVAYLRGYLDVMRNHDGPALLPATDGDVAVLLSAFVLDKALYEVRYELDHRPEWAGIPLAGVLRLLGITPPKA